MKRHLNDYAVKSLPLAGSVQYDVWCSQLPRFGLRIGKRTKTFVLNVGKRRVTLGRYPLISLKQARDEAKRRLAAKYLPQASVPARIAVEEYLRAKKDTHKPSTHRVYEIYLRLLDKPVDQIDARYVYSVLPDGKGAGNLSFNVIKAFLSWCVERDYIQHNPLLRRRQPNRLRARDRLLTNEEFAAIWCESFRHNSFGGILRTLFLTGQRINQIASLRKEWLRGDTLVFPESVMKGNTEHTIPVTQEVRKHLTFFDQPFGVSDARKKMQAALPDIPHWTPHDARRFLSSTMAMLGTPIHVTEQILAHKTGTRSPIQRVYDRHTYLDEMRTALEAYERHLFTAVLAEQK